MADEAIPGLPISRNIVRLARELVCISDSLLPSVYDSVGSAALLRGVSLPACRTPINMYFLSPGEPVLSASQLFQLAKHLDC